MNCPQCGVTLPFIPCPECGGEIPEKSDYCCWCGSLIPTEMGEAALADRKLCSDGNCVGTINEKGICNVCGKPYGESGVRAE